MAENRVILIVDDDDDDDDDSGIVKSIAKYLESAGYAVLVSKNGKQALEIFNKEKPDLVIADIYARNERSRIAGTVKT